MKQADSTIMQAAGQTAANRMVAHIQQASQQTGVSFSYLMAQANKESAFEADAGSRSSSAAGLFQFTKGTWLQLIKHHGAAYGLGSQAEAIHRTAKGEYTVSDPAARQKILDLRRDPGLSSLMAGEYAKDNKSLLEKTLGRSVNSTELYMAHFLGPGGAAKILKARADNPTQAAAEVVPQAARKNPSVFYDSNHSPRSIAAVYERVGRSIDRPMKQYAYLEAADTATTIGAASSTAIASAVTSTTASAVTAAGATKHHGRAGTAVASAETHWPFEAGQWPPTYVPSTATATSTASVVETTDASIQVASADVASASGDGTDGWQSADTASGPMPPALHSPSDALKGTLGRLFENVKRGLFG